ncbi:MAG: YebC/PmpR family DNA-binding transcriptional regulator [bacterium]|nr:YebC/PmpR family DNA-binding transcriptional regulator [bacterium]
MSGHSKWATIKRKKAAIDAERGKAFTRVIRELTISAREGGSNPDGNPRLRRAVEDAKAVNMPADNITRAIKKGAGELEGVHYEEIVYEAYAPGGTAVLIETLTDNRNRTISEIRHMISKRNGNLAEANSVGWMFERKGVITIDGEGIDEDKLMEVAIEAGAEDVVGEEGMFEVYTAPHDLEPVLSAIEKAGIKIESGEAQRVAKNKVKVEGSDARTLIGLLDALDEHDDVQKVWTNADIVEEDE